VLLLLGLSLSKGISLSLYPKAPVIFDGLELKPSSDMSMRIYSVADIAERAMLGAVFQLVDFNFWALFKYSLVNVNKITEETINKAHQ
jgi:hypothetical protein